MKNEKMLNEELLRNVTGGVYDIDPRKDLYENIILGAAAPQQAGTGSEKENERNTVRPH